MEEKVKNDILAVLKESLTAVKDNDTVKLKDLSNQTIHDASTLQDEYSISIAVIIYSIAKIFERTRYREYEDWKVFYENLVDGLTKAKKALENDEVVEYEHNIHRILQVVDKLGRKFRNYVIDVINKAKISKASRMHEHGLSIGRTAELLGISEWELTSYIGETGIADVPFNVTKTEKERLKAARKAFE